ncbi:hypothetical protein ACFPER_05580 [Agromyces aurantiacus]|uniref:DUF4175 domain-containing protein n=1 Tax=Agromyces aurantiacus TaxID=165814 RepID=A0ABV9R3U2_9MICO|nr:hypothetical protein [Agromyces aurantiacus]MBM7502929.1 putative membrane protein YdbT with pleckstrin-like domain [Agromyces aurantiacus]
MADETPTPTPQRFFRACLLLLGGVLALWFALELLTQIWGWLLLIAAIAVIWCIAVWAYRYWWSRRF